MHHGHAGFCFTDSYIPAELVFPDVFGLRAFEENLPITRMLPGSSPCELRLLLPDSMIGKEGFHDVVVENLTTSSTWRSRHVSPSDVIALRRRWPKAVFQVMKERGTEMEHLRRQAYRRPEGVYRHAQPGCCPVCKTTTESSLESHMMCCHLDLGQLWRCPVEWCAVWKGSVRECREHFNDKHSGSATLDFENVSRSFPPWTVPRDLWERALRPEVSGIAVETRLFHEAGRRLVHKYRVYKDPLPHPALREGVVAKLLSFVRRSMAIARLTHLQISVPSSGASPGEVPNDIPAVTTTSRRVTFAPIIQTTMEDTDLQVTDMDSLPADECTVAMDAESGPTKLREISEMTISPPPGFPQFQWPQADWILEGEPSIDPGLKFVTSWSTRIVKERSAGLPSLPTSPITAEGSQDSMMVQVGSPADATPKPAGLDQIRSTHRGRPRRPLKRELRREKPAPAADFLFKKHFARSSHGCCPETDGN